MNALSGAEAFVRMLQLHGVRHIFGLCGYARVIGRVGVCEGPSGGGATYLLPGVVEWRER